MTQTSRKPFKIRSTAPDADVLFYPFTKEKTKTLKPDQKSSIDTTEISAYDAILSINTSKSKGRAGSFNMVLAPTKNWKGLLHPGCWCLIYISDKKLPALADRSSKLEDGLKMIGIVKSVNRLEQIDPGTGTRTVRYQIAGVDFHAVFDGMQYINAHLAQINSTEGQGIYSSFFLGYGDRFKTLKKPDEMIQNLIDVLLGRPAFLGDIKSDKPLQEHKISARAGQPFKVPKAMAKRVLGYRKSGAADDMFTGMVTLFLQRNLLGTILQRPEIMGVHSTWSILESFSNKILNELYTDMLPVNLKGAVRTLPSLVFRATPFSSDQLNKKYEGPVIRFSEAKPFNKRKVPSRLRGQAFSGGDGKQKRPKTVDDSHFFISRQIAEDEIYAMQYGKSDNERFNLFLVSPNVSGLKGSGEAALIRSLAGGDSPQGVRGILGRISDLTSIVRYGLRPYISQSNYINDDVADIKGINAIVKDMWENAYLYETGTVSLIGVDEYIPVGTNIEFSERGWVAHVEQTSNSYSVDPSSKTKTFRTNINFVRLQKTDGTPVDLTEQDLGSKNDLVIDTWDRGAGFTSFE